MNKRAIIYATLAWLYIVIMIICHYLNPIVTVIMLIALLAVVVWAFLYNCIRLFQ